MIRAALAWAVLLATAGGGEAPRPALSAVPSTLSGVAGQPLVLTLEIRIDHAASPKLKLPPDPLLHLRATEAEPVASAPGGGVLYRKRIVWQGLEPGETTLDRIAVVIDGIEHFFPPVQVRILKPEEAR